MGRNSEQVLVVAPERTRNRGVVEALTAAGYCVNTVRPGRELRVALASIEPAVDVVIACGLSERQLDEIKVRIRRTNPDLAILVQRETDAPGTPPRSGPTSLRGVFEIPFDDDDLGTAVGWSKERTSLLRRIRFLEDHLHESNAGPEERIRETQDVAIFGLAKMVESRDEDTGFHLERMAEYSRLLAESIRDHPLYAGYISDEYIGDVWRSAPLHDIGKVGVPDQILLKPGKLTADEWDVMRTHSTVGGDTLRKIEGRLHYRSFLRMGRDIAYCHHEKWNGQGYPFGLSGDEIPLSARIVAMADVYDALTSKRPYKEPFSHEKARSIIEEGVGTHFDPTIWDGFIRVEAEIRRVAERHDPSANIFMQTVEEDHEIVVQRYRRNGRRMRTLRELVEERMRGSRLRAAAGV